MAKVEVAMPKMGESITEGTVIVWHKQPGDQVEMDETLLEIGTDKVDTDVPSPAAGILKEILVAEDETVEVGTPIAIIETDVAAAGTDTPADAPPTDEASDDDAPADEAPANEAPANEAPADEASDNDAAEGAPTDDDQVAEPPAAPAPTAQPAPAPAGDDVQVVMPKMGESITEGTVLVWHKKPGDEIELDETLLEIGTDKVDTEVPSPAAGVLKQILVEEGETVEVGTPIAVIGAEAGAAVAAAPAPTQAAPTEAAPAAPEAASAPPTPTPATASGDGAAPAPADAGGPLERHGPDGRFYSPLVRSIAEKEGLSMQELTTIAGTGREGRLTKEDVLGYIERRSSRPAPAAQPAAKAPPRKTDGRATSKPAGARVEVVPMDRMRQIIAEHMVRSKATSAHVTSFAEVDVTNLVRLREHNKDAFLQREGVKLTYTPFFVEAAVEALRDHPLLNASVDGKEIHVRHDFHIGIAVALEKAGLVAPVIRDAGHKNLVGLARAAADLATRARSKQLQPDQLQGGTFTVTNIGSLGSIMGTPIINQPQVAILATGAIKKRPVVLEDPTLGDVIAVRSIMYVSLSYDHRIIDGAMAASFLHRFSQVLESYDPNTEL